MWTQSRGLGTDNTSCAHLCSLSDGRSRRRGPTNGGSQVDEYRTSLILRPVEAADDPLLRRLELSQELGATWRLIDHPSPEGYAASLWDGVQANYLAMDGRTGGGLGLFSVYGLDTHNRVCRLAAARFDRTARSGLIFLVAFDAVVGATFDTYDIRKIYLDVPAFNFDPIRSMVDRGIFQVEGLLREFRYYRGAHWDQYVLSLSRAGAELLHTYSNGDRVRDVASRLD